MDQPKHEDNSIVKTKLEMQFQYSALFIVPKLRPTISRLQFSNTDTNKVEQFVKIK